MWNNRNRLPLTPHFLSMSLCIIFHIPLQLNQSCILNYSCFKIFEGCHWWPFPPRLLYLHYLSLFTLFNFYFVQITNTASPLSPLQLCVLHCLQSQVGRSVRAWTRLWVGSGWSRRVAMSCWYTSEEIYNNASYNCNLNNKNYVY